jgi:hypothetical protein
VYVCCMNIEFILYTPCMRVVHVRYNHGGSTYTHLIAYSTHTPTCTTRIQGVYNINSIYIQHTYTLMIVVGVGDGGGVA